MIQDTTHKQQMIENEIKHTINHLNNLIAEAAINNMSVTFNVVNEVSANNVNLGLLKSDCQILKSSPHY